jgi:hypothetical protein
MRCCFCCANEEPKADLERTLSKPSMTVPYFIQDPDVTGTSYYMTVSKSNYELDLTRIQVWVYDKDYKCVHGTTDKYVNIYDLNQYLGGRLSYANDQEWSKLIKGNPKIIECKRTVILNDNLLYVDSIPLYSSETTCSYLGHICIIIPYKDAEKMLSFDEKNYTQVDSDGALQIYRPNKEEWIYKVLKETINYEDTGYKEDDAQLVKYKKIKHTIYELNMDRIEIWVFDKDLKCIHGTHKDENKYGLEYYLGRHIDELEDVMCLKLKIIVMNSLRMKDMRSTMEINEELVYIETRTLYYNTKVKNVYGCMIIIIPYQYEVISDLKHFRFF